MKTIYIVPIEPLDNRYTKQWYENIPVILTDAIKSQNLDAKVLTIGGRQLTSKPTYGAFLDFAATNAYKASQAELISAMFNDGSVNAGDKFLVTDAWNFVITPIRYMSELLGIPVEIHSIWHAGAYDPSDILGAKMSKPWANLQETAWFHASDYNYYASHFHLNMFLKNLNIPDAYAHKAIRSGQPHTQLVERLSNYPHKKEPTLLFPHRLNADKQPDILLHIEKEVNANVYFTQVQNLSKDDYYDVLGKTEFLFSCSLHENLGISVMEGVLAGAIPIVPGRASYSEMYLAEFKYPAKWTASYDLFIENRQHLIDFINNLIESKKTNPEKYEALLAEQRKILIDKYLTPTIMVKQLLENL